MAVPINVADTYSTVPENVHAAGFVEHATPVIGVTREMAFITWVLSESGRSHICEHDLRTFSRGHFDGLPAGYFPPSGGLSPFDFPFADCLPASIAPSGQFSAKFEAEACLGNRWMVIRGTRNRQAGEVRQIQRPVRSQEAA